MSAHTAAGVEKNVAVTQKLGFASGLTALVGKYEKNGMQIRTYFNGIESAKGIMGLMVDLTNVKDMFTIKIEVTGANDPAQCDVEAHKVMEALEKYFA